MQEALEATEREVQQLARGQSEVSGLAPAAPPAGPTLHCHPALGRPDEAISDLRPGRAVLAGQFWPQFLLL